MERDVRFDGGLIDSVLVAPVENLFLREVFVRRERASRRGERRRAVASAAVGFVSAVASPVGGDYDIGVRAFGRLDEKAFDEPEDGHGGIS